jgi:hypothetical protein
MSCRLMDRQGIFPSHDKVAASLSDLQVRRRLAARATFHAVHRALGLKK